MPDSPLGRSDTSLTGVEGMMVVRRIVGWLRGDDAAMIREEAMKVGIPPEDALAHAIELRWSNPSERS